MVATRWQATQQFSGRRVNFKFNAPTDNTGKPVGLVHENSFDCRGVWLLAHVRSFTKYSAVSFLRSTKDCDLDGPGER